MSDLLCCPFCGASAELDTFFNSGASLAIYCTNGETYCPAEMRISREDSPLEDDPEEITRQLAVELTEYWNNREK